MSRLDLSSPWISSGFSRITPVEFEVVVQTEITGLDGYIGGIASCNCVVCCQKRQADRDRKHGNERVAALGARMCQLSM